jgi:hypothetical protein
MAGRLASLSDEQFVDLLYSVLLLRQADPGGRAYMLEKLTSGVGRLDLLDLFLASEEYGHARRQLGFAPPGHFNSPLPSQGEIQRHRAFDWDRPSIPGVDLREGEQVRLLEALARHYPKIPFERQPSGRARYGYDNPSYGEGDAIILFTMILHLAPRRIIEVGSGYSSCAIMDAADRLERRPELTFIEPFPLTLKSRVWAGDLDRNRLLEQGLQQVPLAAFQALEPNDILFIDSSHVAKLGSDVNYLFFEILPTLRPGVFVHIHDIYHPFEYPVHWYEEGRAWNETHLLHAFLQFNDSWRVEICSDYILRKRRDWFEKYMPVALRNTGGHIWMSRVR